MTIVACPKCADSVVLPGRASQRATVRCPLCQEQFPLAEVLDKMPPALIVVDDPDAAAAVPWPAAAQRKRRRPAVRRAGKQRRRIRSPEHRDGRARCAGDGCGRAGDGPQRRRNASPRVPSRRVVKIVLGGVAGLVIAQVILWWIGSAKEWPSKRADISGLAPKIARFAPWIVPERYRGQKPPGEAVSAPEPGASAVARRGEFGGGQPKELPQRTFVDPNESAAATGTAKAPVAKTKKPGKSQKTAVPEPLAADAREADPFGIAAPPAKPEPDLTAVPEPETDPLADMKLDTEMLPDDKPVADPVVEPR